MIHVTEGPLNIDLLRESYQNEFFSYIDAQPSPKVIYWEKDLLAHMSSVVNNSDLKKHGVMNSFLLQSAKDSCSPSACKSVVFIINPKVSIVDSVQSFLVRDSQSNQSAGKQYSIIAIPRISLACKSFLKEKKMINKFAMISEFPLTIVPVECDVLSMEDSQCFANYSISERQDGVYQFVQGLMRFQSIFGICRPCLQTDNEASKKFILNSSDMVYAEIRDQKFSEVGLILSKITKEISNIVTQSKSAKELTDLRLAVSRIPEIRSKQSQLEIHTSLAEEIQKYVSTDDFLSILRAQQDFINGYETDKAHPFIEECILRGAPIEEVLRLICIQSFCNGGLKQRLLDYYRNEIIQVYGFEHIFTLDNLERVGLLYESPSSLMSSIQTSSFTPQEKINSRNSSLSSSKLSANLKQTIINISTSYNSVLKGNLRLVIPPNSNSVNDSEQAASSLFSGYIPISIRLIQVWTNDWYPKPNLSLTSRGITDQTTLTGGSSGSFLLSKATRIVSGLRSSENLEMSVLPVFNERNTSEFNSHTTLTPTAGKTGGFLPNNSLTATSNRTTSSLSNLICAPEFKVQLPVRDELPFTSKSGCLNMENHPNKPRIVVVGFVGGVSHAEISILRTIAASEDANVEFVVITTGFITAQSFISSLCQPVKSTNLIPF
ncbi:vacuolar protein sorting (vps33), putative [Schistosoma mansoni]|uniref:vacuolar protein sorting (vps33), putative n=1 Tax=Schistosoma mansoni TaxID=6183 RepID=UPI00022C8560|nr:vacuolar protein sorting (vps33), putative [Schistosoma mansoni]|eukprot:XP_018645424.1 vacuolar protein sorting (vps33), putative [Schistosoma mansoni]